MRNLTWAHDLKRGAARFTLGLGMAVAMALPFAGALPTSAAAVAAPTRAQITAIMRRTVEVQNRTEHFTLTGRPLTIQDGRGTGTLTAAIGTRYPTADAHGQLVFFWHNATFIGWDSKYESAAIQSVRSGAAGAYTITYVRYAPNDPMCCPSRRPLTIHYGWSGHILISDGAPPKYGKPGVQVMLLKH